jgi:hypothetical protein
MNIIYNIIYIYIDLRNGMFWSAFVTVSQSQHDMSVFWSMIIIIN